MSRSEADADTVAVPPVATASGDTVKAVSAGQLFTVPVTATVFREGHDAVAATVVVTDPDGAVHTRVRMHSLGPGLDRWGATVVPDREGRWTFRVEGWSDAHGTWDDENLTAAQIVAHHNEVMGNGFAEVVPAGEISFREPVGA